MKIVVAVKRVLDQRYKVQLQSDGRALDNAHTQWVMNPFDAVALEAALRLKDHAPTTEVVVVSIGPPPCQAVLRTALAMGADRALWYSAAPTPMLEPLHIAKILRHCIAHEQPLLALLGQQASDSDNGQTGPMLAALLRWPQACAATALHLERHTAVVTCDDDRGRATFALHLPAVITTALQLYTPRRPSLPNIMRAQQKPLQQLTLAQLGLDTVPRQTQLQLHPAPPRQPGVIVPDVAALVTKLRDVTKVRC